MLPLIFAVLAASLLGSLHCAGMCGGFVAIAVAPGARSSIAPWRLSAAYNFGRLLTYSALGALAGAIGHAIDLGGGRLGVQRTAAAVAGAVMVVFGAVAIARVLGLALPSAPVPEPLRRLVVAAHAFTLRWGPLARALAIGMLTTLLPCGWLYAFVATAAGTGDPWLGAATMGVFWLGTLPVMAALGLGVQGLLGPLRRHMPVATAVLLVVVGLFTLSGRVRPPELSRLDPSCCGPAPSLPHAR